MKFTGQEFNEVYEQYLKKFGPCPYIGLDDDQLEKLFEEMQKALAGERAGDITEDEFYTGGVSEEKTI